MTELEAYREWMRDWETVNPEDELDSFSARVAWQAACAWQIVHDFGIIGKIDDGEAPEYRACQEAIMDQKTG